MMVDTLTYLFNWYAERQKRAYSEVLARGDSIGEIAMLRFRKYHLILELVAPFASVSILLVVTGFVLQKAIHVLVLDASRDISLQSNPNITWMIVFSSLNLLLDILNVSCFARAQHALGYKTKVESDTDHKRAQMQIKSMQGLLDDDEHARRYEDENDDEKQEKMVDSSAFDENETFTPRLMEPFEIDDDDAGNDDGGSNLNMCSAYTHVFADTLRSLAVILASLLATFVPTITPEEADAAAAIAVSILIVVSLVPLLRGMLGTVRRLQEVNGLLIEGLMETLAERSMDSYDSDFV